MRVRRLSLRTEQSYLLYIWRYIQFHNRKPDAIDEADPATLMTISLLRAAVFEMMSLKRSRMTAPKTDHAITFNKRHNL
jgi:hypothetical protein